MINRERRDTACCRVTPLLDEPDQSHAVRAAGNGHASAQYNLGRMLQFGEGLVENDSEAAEWYQRAAEQGLAVAQYNLGWMYENGEGVTEQDQEALKWYQQAAAKEYAAAQYNLGVMHQSGEGVEGNLVEAYAWYNLAASNGHEAAAAGKVKLAEFLDRSQIDEAQSRSRQLREDF